MGIKNIKILNLGCGRGAKINQLEKRGIVTGVDISEDFINECKATFPNSNFIVADIEKKRFKKRFYDEIYCIDVIEHVNNPTLVLQNIQHTIKKEGYLFLDIPYYISEQLLNMVNRNYYKEINHKTVFNFQKIIDLLNNNHFKIIDCKYNKFFDNIYLQYFFLRKKNIINQQGDFKLKSELDTLMSFLVQFIYKKNPIKDILNTDQFNKFNKISKQEYGIGIVELVKSIKISNEINSKILPKTISLTCRYSNNPKNTISDLKESNNLKIKLNSFSNKSIVNKINKEIEKNKKENISLTNELNTIKKSKLFKLWPFYNKFKKFLK